MQSSVKKRSNIVDDGQTFLLGTAWEQIFAVHVLSFLSSHELCISSSTNRFFHHCTKTNHLWFDLMKANFCFPYDNYQQDNNKYNADNANNFISNGYINSIQNASTYVTPRGTVRNGRGENFSGNNSILSAKDRYAMRVFDRNERYQKARDKAILSIAKIEKDRQRRLIQSFLDLTLFRILIPLPLTTLFLSILLFTLHYDGFNISIWAAAAPLIFYFIYLLVFTIVSYVVYKQVCSFILGLLHITYFKSKLLSMCLFMYFLVILSPLD